ncbi:MAG: alpha/beta hydrolase [Rhodobacteraceae bacterium]|nr:alpha/beta hydrolase [Paracoccaceae bacterium]
MSKPTNLETAAGRRLAYRQTDGRGPGIVFLGGFKSDMEGTKATWLAEWCRAEGRAFLRFDYSGHGASSGAFEDGAIGDWAADAEAAISTLTNGPQVLIGSSMGGWISLLLAKRMPQRVAALVTIAAAPDFTEDGYWASFSDDERRTVMESGKIAVPSDYGAPYIITRRLIEEGRENFVLRDSLHLPFPVRFLQGTEDAAVPLERATTLLSHATGDDMRLVVLKGADHSFSSPDALQLIEDALRNALGAIDAD